MTRRIRILLGLVIFVISILLLIWSFRPLEHETRTQPIAPSELQLPTPLSFRFDLPLGPLNASPGPIS